MLRRARPRAGLRAAARPAAARPEGSPERSVSSPGFRGRISYNALVRLGGRAAGGLVALVALHVGTHYFTPDRWGPIVAATALIGVFASVSDFGVQQIASRDLASRGADARSLYGAALAATPVTAGAATAVAALVVLVVYSSHPEVRVLAYVLLPTVPFTALWLMSSSVFVARARNDVRAVLDIGSSVLVLGAVLLVRFTHGGATRYVMFIAVAMGVTAAASVALARMYVVPRLRGSARQVGGLVRRAAPIGLTYGANALYGQVDTVVVALLASSGALAAFGVASQIAGFAAAVPAMLLSAVTPHFMRKDDAERRVLLQRSFDTLVTVAAVLPVGAALFAHVVVSAIAGAGYSGATVPLVLLVSAAALGFPTAVYGHGLVLVGAERRVPRGVYAALLLNLAGNLIAVPIAGITGAAVVLVVSELALLAIRFREFRVAAGYVPSFARSATALLVAAGLAAVYGVGDEFLGLRVSHGPVAVLEAGALVGAYALLVSVARHLVPTAHHGSK